MGLYNTSRSEEGCVHVNHVLLDSVAKRNKLINEGGKFTGIAVPENEPGKEGMCGSVFCERFIQTI